MSLEGHPFFVPYYPVTRGEWIVRCNWLRTISIDDHIYSSDKINPGMCFKHEADAIAFKLKFGL